MSTRTQLVEQAQTWKVRAEKAELASFNRERDQAQRITELERENAKLREAGAELLKACPHEAEGEQRALAALKMRDALKL